MSEFLDVSLPREAIILIIGEEQWQDALQKTFDFISEERESAIVERVGAKRAYDVYLAGLLTGKLKNALHKAAYGYSLN